MGFETPKASDSKNKSGINKFIKGASIALALGLAMHSTDADAIEKKVSDHEKARPEMTQKLSAEEAGESERLEKSIFEKIKVEQKKIYDGTIEYATNLYQSYLEQKKLQESAGKNFSSYPYKSVEEQDLRMQAYKKMIEEGNINEMNFDMDGSRAGYYVTVGATKVFLAFRFNPISLEVTGSFDEIVKKTSPAEMQE